MRAICRALDLTAQIREVPRPEITAGHVLVKVHACAINPGDKAWLAGAIPGAPESLHDIAGVSGAGEVITLGDGVPLRYQGKKVAFYRSLKFSDHLVGTWSEYARLHYLHCVILPDDANLEEYCGSLVNVITPYAFWKQVIEAGSPGIICTAGTSATGRAMIGVCKIKDLPCIALVRKTSDIQNLEALGATQVLALDAANFEHELETLAAKLGAVAVFDGVGGEMLSRVAPFLPQGASIYAYGFLGGNQPFCIQTSQILIKGLHISGFGNFVSATVLDPQRLEQALEDISNIIHRPHFKMAIGQRFRFEEIPEALSFSSSKGERAILIPG